MRRRKASQLWTCEQFPHTEGAPSGKGSGGVGAPSPPAHAHPIALCASTSKGTCSLLQRAMPSCHGVDRGGRHHRWRHLYRCRAASSPRASSTRAVALRFEKWPSMREAGRPQWAEWVAQGGRVDAGPSGEKTQAAVARRRFDPRSARDADPWVVATSGQIDSSVSHVDSTRRRSLVTPACIGAGHGTVRRFRAWSLVNRRLGVRVPSPALDACAGGGRFRPIEAARRAVSAGPFRVRYGANEDPQPVGVPSGGLKVQVA